MVADGLEEVECLAVVDVLFRAGIGADLLSISDSLEVTSSHGIHLRCDALASQVDLASYALMFLPGGMPGTLNLGASALVTDEVCRRSAAGQPLAAICAAPLSWLSMAPCRLATPPPTPASWMLSPQVGRL